MTAKPMTLTTRDQVGDHDSAHESPPSLIIHVRGERSMLMHLLQGTLRILRPMVVRPGATHDDISERLTAPKKVTGRCDVIEREIDGLRVYDLEPKAKVMDDQGITDKRTRRIYYFAGGGWKMPASDNHWGLVSELACLLPNTKVSLISYPLAPKHPAHVAFPRIATTYSTLMAELAKADERIIVAGDSAGGNLSLCLVTWSLADAAHGGPEQSILPPEAVMGICPTVDLYHVDAKIKEVEKKDPLMTLNFLKSTAQGWCGVSKDLEAEGASMAAEERDAIHLDFGPKDPRVSPIRANLKPLVENKVKVHGVTAGYDVLAPEAVLFRDRCKAQGVRGEWLEWDRQFHCFPLTFQYGLWDGKAAMDWVIDVLRRT